MSDSVKVSKFADVTMEILNLFGKYNGMEAIAVLEITKYNILKGDC